MEELIKEGATVWESKYGKVKEFDLSTIGDFLMSKEYIKVLFYQPHNFITRKRFSKLFENKEDAEFSKYQNIPRTETLSLPTWEEIENDYIEPNIILFHRFMNKNNTEAELVVDCFDNKIEVLGVGGAYNIWEATKANYLEACELCRKLFLGEEEE